MLKWIFNILIIAFLTVLETSFFAVLPFFQYFHPVLLYIVYLAVKKNSFMPAAILSGYILDLYSSYPFGLHIAAIVLSVALSNYIYFNLITSRRFFTVLILAAVSIIIYHATLLLGIAALSFLKLSSNTDVLENFRPRTVGIEIISVCGAASAAYFIYYYIRKNILSRLMLKNYASK